MEIRKSNRRPISLIFFLIALFLLTLMPMSKAVYADEVATEKTDAMASVEKIMFVTFKKGESEKDGKFLVGCFYVPNEIFNETYTYGVLICPKDYLTKLNLSDDYIETFEERGIAYASADVTGGLTSPEGRIFRVVFGNMRPTNLDRVFAFIFYVIDDAGNREYCKPEYTAYNTNIDKNYSNAELLEKLESKQGMENSFKSIVTKLDELIDSVWIYVIISGASIVIIWGAYIGIRLMVAKKNEEKVNSKGMIKGLAIGIVIVFVLAVGLPLLIEGLGAWVG